MENGQRSPARFPVLKPFIETFARKRAGRMGIHSRWFIYYQQVVIFKKDQARQGRRGLIQRLRF